MVPQLVKVSEDLKAGRAVDPVTVRTFLSWFGAQRRGYNIVAGIKAGLAAAGVMTDPDIEYTWIDGQINFLPVGTASTPEESESSATGEEARAQDASESPAWVSRDATYRVSRLQAANQKIVSCKPDSPISEVVTLLLAGGFSQLPVMISDRDVKGMVTWKSIGMRVALGYADGEARHFMVPQHEIRAESSIFAAIPIIVENDYVLVRGQANLITGIITANDLSLQFRQLTEPFLLIGEIENMIRNMIGNKFSVADLASARDSSSGDASISSVADMTFGEYVRLLENAERWEKFGLPVDRVIFCKNLDKVRLIRNDVTHFDPDGITAEDLDTLRSFASFLKDLESIFGS
jgi:hypothetical protein